MTFAPPTSPPTRRIVDAITEDPDAALTRKNRFLNHLLARFSEQFSDYSLVLPQALPSSTGICARSAGPR